MINVLQGKSHRETEPNYGRPAVITGQSHAAGAVLNTTRQSLTVLQSSFPPGGSVGIFGF